MADEPKRGKKIGTVGQQKKKKKDVLKATKKKKEKMHST